MSNTETAKTDTKKQTPPTGSAIVLNNCERIIIGQSRMAGVGAASALGSQKPVLPGQLVFHPGVTIVAESDLDALRKENSAFNAHFVEKLRAIKAAEGPGPERVGRTRLEIMASGVDPRAPLEKLDDKTAIKVIGETFNQGTLGSWKSKEKRPEIRLKIINQIEFLKTGKKDDEEEIVETE